MRLFRSIAGLRCFLELQRFSHDRLEPEALYPGFAKHVPLDVGFVPTMGALHQGHLSLIQRARRENKTVVVSIFVNPLQFAPTEDLDRYPRTLDADQALCKLAGVDALFVPSSAEMGIDHRTGSREQGAGSEESQTLALTQVIPPSCLIADLCGRSRIGHFQGVATIVTKLLNIIQPTRAYFGQKDAQQLAVIRRLVADLNLSVEVVACPTLREADGLAKSSRNQYLNPLEREQATVLYQGLRQAEDLFRAGERSSSTLVEAVKAELRQVPAIAQEYVELVDPMTMETLKEINETGLLAVAARLGTTRLIDNVLLSTRRPIVAIDGPAGAGKSTVTRMVAQMLGLLHLDTGAMYRAFTWFVLEAGVEIQDEAAIAELLSQCHIEFKYPERADATSSLPATIITVNSQDVSQVIRTLEVTANVSAIAAQPSVRQHLVKRQQALGRMGGVVMEGRDIGTNVFPDAELKIFLTASVEERARRRQRDLRERGIGEVSLQDLERSISDRDRQDSTRLVSPLRKAADAIELNTDGLSVPQVCDRIVSLYQAQLAGQQ